MKTALILCVGSACVAAFAQGCDGEADDCTVTATCPAVGATGGEAGSAGEGGSGGIAGNGGGGNGGTPMGGGGVGGAPECMGDEDCTSPTAAHCDNGECVPCTASPQCVGVPNAPVCDAGTCVECLLGEEDACTGGETCDLLAKTCVPVGVDSVGECEACTNDVQCAGDFRCIPLDFPTGTLHGYYCLRTFPPACNQPFAIAVSNKVSISGAAAANYCGIEEDNATCEAVRALFENWHCTGADGMCSELIGGLEIPVPGALCRDLGGGAVTDRCTYHCGGAGECLLSGNGSTCGGTPGPTWCGG